jgi:hypothetical protein
MNVYHQTVVGAFCNEIIKFIPRFPVTAFDSSRFSFPGFRIFLLAKMTLPHQGIDEIFAFTA